MTRAAIPTPEQIIYEFHNRGYVVLQGLITTNVISSVILELEAWVNMRAQELLDAGKISDSCELESFDHRLASLQRQCAEDQIVGQTLRQELHWPGMFGLFFHTQLLNIVESIVGPEVRLYPNYSIRPKLPRHAPTKVLWHQDAAYTSSGAHGSDAQAGDQTAEQLRMVNLWTPLVRARVANGCMKFIPRSHKVGIVPHRWREHYLEITPEVLQPYLQDAIDIECDPGDVALFSNLLFHMGQDNVTDTVRWSADWRYQDATQSTMRADRGHLARSREYPDEVVQSAEHWAKLSFV